jgi:DNA-directed RNA polymerase subunit RPC12/RpoP
MKHYYSINQAIYILARGQAEPLTKARARVTLEMLAHDIYKSKYTTSDEARKIIHALYEISEHFQQINETFYTCEQCNNEAKHTEYMTDRGWANYNRCPMCGMSTDHYPYIMQNIDPPSKRHPQRKPRRQYTRISTSQLISREGN